MKLIGILLVSLFTSTSFAVIDGVGDGGGGMTLPYLQSAEMFRAVLTNNEIMWAVSAAPILSIKRGGQGILLSTASCEVDIKVKAEFSESEVIGYVVESFKADCK